jgi:hypothetical protein
MKEELPSHDDPLPMDDLPIEQPKFLWHDDGNSFMCAKCSAVIPRTRANPYPNHQCK